MVNYKLLLFYVLTVIAYNGTPGPVIMLVTGTRLSHSFKHTFATILGANLGSITLMLISVFSMLGLFSINENILNILKVLGCCYLLFLSCRSILSVGKVFFLNKTTESLALHYFKGGIRQGYSIGASNPKDIMFFISFFPQFINVTASHTNSLLILCLIWVLFDWLILCFYAVLVSKVISKMFEMVFISFASIFILAIAIYGIVGVFFN